MQRNVFTVSKCCIFDTPNRERMTTSTEYRTIEISKELLQKNIERSHCAGLASSLFGSESDSHVDLEVSHFLQMVTERISNCSDFYFFFLYGMEQIPSLSGTVARIKQVHSKFQLFTVSQLAIAGSLYYYDCGKS